MRRAVPVLSWRWHMSAWLDAMREITVADAAERLGLTVQDPRGAGGGSVSPCPACDAVTRHTKSHDRRGALGLAGNGLGWRCFQCDASGDALDLVSLVKHRARWRDLADGYKAAVRAWCASEWPAVGRALEGAQETHRASTRAVEAKPPSYPPKAEVAALWAACAPVTSDPDVASWLRDKRAIDPAAVARFDLARCLTGETPLFAWSVLGGKTWLGSGHRLIVPMFDAAGELRSVIGRRVPDPPKGSDIKKSVAPKGFQRVGLVMADTPGQSMLAGGHAPPPRGLVVVAEGELDVLSWATEAPGGGDAVLGMVQGAWADDVAARIPDGATLVVATDRDKDGDKYALRVAKSLAERSVKLLRWPLEELAPELGDANDVRRAGLPLVPDGRPLEAAPGRTRRDATGWQALLTVDDKDRVQKTPHNAALILGNDPEWDGVLCFNERSDRVLFQKSPPWHDDYAGTKETYPREVRDDDATRTSIWIERKMRVAFNPDLLAKTIDVAARQRVVEPVRDELEALTWDGERRVDTWLARYLGVADTIYARAVGAKWLISAIARAFRPGCKADHVLVLEGRQGQGKSTALSVLAGPEHFSDQISKLGEKDAAIQLQGPWIVELSELDAMNRSEISAIKGFITITSDDYRSPYGRRVERHPRRCVFAGTTNEEVYLRDATGNRRFWPVKCGMIDLEGLRADRAQLLAEAVVRFRAGEAWHLEDGASRDHASSAQEERYQVDAWEQTIAEYLETGPVKMAGWVTIAEVLESALKIEIGKAGRGEQMRAQQALGRCGWVRRQRQEGGVRRWVYVPMCTNGEGVGAPVGAHENPSDSAAVHQRTNPHQPIQDMRTHARAHAPAHARARVGELLNLGGEVGALVHSDETTSDLGAPTSECTNPPVAVDAFGRVVEEL